MRLVAIASLCAVSLALACGEDSPTEVAPESYTLEASTTPDGPTTVGTTVTAAVQVTDGSGEPADGVPVRWSVLDGGGGIGTGTVATDGSGLASIDWTVGTSAGEQRLEAAVDGTESVAFELDATPGDPAAIELSPSTITFDVAGESAEVTAHVVDRYDNRVPEPTVSWTSDTPGVASVDGDGTVQSQDRGTATVTAVADTAEAKATVLVDPEPASVEVQPVTAGPFDGPDTVRVGEELTQDLEAVVRDENGHAITGADVTWSVSDPNTATVGSTGTVTGHREGATTVTAESGETSGSIAAVVPGKIGFASRRDGNYEMYLVNADGTAPTRITHDEASDFSPTWSPDGTKVAARSDRDGNGEIYTFNPDGTRPTNLSNHPDFDTSPSWSPDGSKLAFYTSRDGNYEIYAVNATGTGLTRLTNDAASDRWPAWSPAGTTIAFTSGRDGDFEIYRVDADGTGLTRLTNDPATDWVPVWAPDGSKIAFRSDRDGGDDVFVMNPDGSDQTNLTGSPGTDRDPAWSPDGTRIAFASDRDGTLDIFVMDADGSNLEKLTDNSAHDLDPVWSPDGTRIAFESNRDGNTEIYVMNADGSDQTRLTDSGSSDVDPRWRPSP